MNLSHPVVSLIPSLTGYVIEVLASTTRPLSGREVHRLVSRDASHKGVQMVLNELARQGIVTQEEHGRTILNTLNRDHILAPIIEELGGTRTRITAEIGAIVQHEAPNLNRGILFGSVARGEADDESDVDLILVWPDNIDVDVQTMAGQRIAERVEALVGNPCRPLHYTTSEFHQLGETAPRLKEAIDDGHIELSAREDRR